MATYKKSDLIKELTDKTGVKRKEAIALLDGLFEIACREAKDGGFLFPGLFKIDMTMRKERRMRNPQTGEAILITEHMAPRIRILKKAKDIITADEPREVIPLDEPIAPAAFSPSPETKAPAPEVPAFKPETSIEESAVPAFTPAASEPAPQVPAFKPETSTEEPAVPAFTPAASEPAPQVPAFKPETSIEEPAVPAFTPAASEPAPEVPAFKPDAPIAEPAEEPAEEQPAGIVYDDFSEAVSFKCQSCGGEIEAPAAAAGFASECPVCGETVVIPAESEPGTIHGAKPDSTSLDNQVEAAAEKAFSEAALDNKKNQTIRIDLSTLDANAPEAPKAKPRIVSFFCKNCNQELEAPAEMMGMKSECPDCGVDFEVPFFSDPGTLHGSDLDKTDVGKADNMHSRTIRIEMPDF